MTTDAGGQDLDGHASGATCYRGHACVIHVMDEVAARLARLSHAQPSHFSLALGACVILVGYMQRGWRPAQCGSGCEASCEAEVALRWLSECVAVAAPLQHPTT
ncbi:unspecified product [Leishmania tarentolae]|uniref:Unspecified product n=1 Tax=Leishmania tarentolae TaxID=5689 RepID=A0A640KKR1_LEITA|nr:unspecified product [Leishmania tarentolae]GET89629.1 unspecified product [Leishmania tarentolae]GET89636.1 unspecified product [Leishmania tarentolae]